MRQYNYPQSFATGVIAAGGTAQAMLPPSTVLAVYGIIAEQDIGSCSLPASCRVSCPRCA
jgi:TRAP-type C4-dicarboxylate transport system permease large subunit